ncbi:MAG: hypothetical protein Q8R02_11195 [Hyphomonadaceae bacterium]|nr:hypothetical protein [Hyphomonadaceae bacterium]
MNLKIIASAIVLAAAATACQQIPDEMTVVEYCSNPDNLKKDVCKVNVEIDGQKRALAETNMSVGQARQIAENALSRANAAQASADAAATSAKQTALHCETRTVQRQKIGSCSPGYKLISCTQTRYTFRAGAPTIMRAIDDNECRFQGQVLEMQLRCCSAGAEAPPTEAVVTQPTTTETPAQSSF